MNPKHLKMKNEQQQQGWSTEAKLLRFITKQLERLSKITFDKGSANKTGEGATIPYKLISLATTNANNIKSSPGTLYSILAVGLNEDEVRFLKFYDTASAPVVGTDIPVFIIPVPTNEVGAGIVISYPLGVKFLNGVSIAITAGSENGNTESVLAKDVILNLTYS